MKNSFLLLASLLWAVLTLAQENRPSTGTSGTVTYEQVVKVEIKLEGEAAQFANMIPKESRSEKILYFSESSSLYENKKAEEDHTMHMESGGGNVMIRMMEPENKVFTDLQKKDQVEMREFMTRTFLIEDKTAASEWKMTGNQKMILDYPCQEAVKEIKDGKASAWFTPVIPVSAGPGNYNGLPGLILAVDINEGKQTLTATSVDLNPISAEQISKPDKGKKVTREEFDKIVEEKMKEMGAEQGEGGTRMMIRIKQ